MAEKGCDGILFSISAPTHVEQMRPQLSYYAQTDFWTLEGVNPEGHARMKAFAQTLGEAMQARRAGARP